MVSLVAICGLSSVGRISTGCRSGRYVAKQASGGLESLFIDSTEAPQRTLETLPFAISGSFQRSLSRYRYSGTGVWDERRSSLHSTSGGWAADAKSGGGRGSGSGNEGSMYARRLRLLLPAGRLELKPGYFWCGTVCVAYVHGFSVNFISATCQCGCRIATAPATQWILTYYCNGAGGCLRDANSDSRYSTTALPDANQ